MKLAWTIAIAFFLLTRFAVGQEAGSPNQIGGLPDHPSADFTWVRIADPEDRVDLNFSTNEITIRIKSGATLTWKLDDPKWIGTASREEVADALAQALLSQIALVRSDLKSEAQISSCKTLPCWFRFWKIQSERIMKEAVQTGANPVKFRYVESNTNDRMYNLSFATAQIATALDLASSYTASRSNPNLYEANPLILGTQDGRFTRRTLAVQGGIAAAGAIAQWAVAKRWPESRRFFKWLNFGLSASHSAAAVHNWRLR